MKMPPGMKIGLNKLAEWYIVISFIKKNPKWFEGGTMKSLTTISLVIFILLLPFAARASEFEVKRIAQEKDLPEKFTSTWKNGDYLVTDGKYLVLVGGSSRMLQSILNYPAGDALGCILSFVPAGRRAANDLVIGPPYVRIDKKRKYVNYVSIKLLQTAADEPLRFQAAASFVEGEARGEILTTYTLSPMTGRIDIASVFKNTGSSALEDLEYGVYAMVDSRYSFSPFHRKRFPGLNYRVYPRQGHSLGWLNLNPTAEEDEELFPGKMGPGDSYEVRYVLLVDGRGENLLRTIYGAYEIKPQTAKIHFKDFDGGPLEVIVRDGLSSAVFFRSFLPSPFSVEVPLPEGFYAVRANFFPASEQGYLQVEEEGRNTCILTDPPKGRVDVKIRNSQGEHVPGKVTFIGLDPTTSPYFKPEDPIQSGRGWESFKNSRYPEEVGLEVTLPVGTYLIYASRGPEYTMDKTVVEVLENDQKELVFTVDRVINTAGYISMDPHMHTQYSDGSVKIPERLRSVIAEGVDIAVATDHNFINDYAPALRKLGLDKHLVVLIGNEVTTGGVIHYNTYPLVLREEEANRGAIDPHSEDVSPLFQASRDKDPGAVLQVNHPRSGTLGYFNNYSLDLDRAAFARTGFDLSFDIVEIMNGPYFYSSNYVAINDWLHLLNRGLYHPLVGSSDAHGIDGAEPGYSRTYVMYADGKTQALDLQALLEALKKGRSFTSNGPFVEFKVNGRHTSGDTFTAPKGRVDIWMKVRSSPWVAVDEVRVIINGERRIVFNVRERKDDVVRFSEEIGLTLERDSYMAIEVLGRQSLYPVMQARSRDGSLEGAALPYALTNPVFVDVDGNGRFDPPQPEKIKLIPEPPKQKQVRRQNY